MTKVAIFGTGLMGQPMALRLASANIPLIAYNRTGEKLIPLQEANLQVTTKAQEAIAFGDCLLLVLANINAIEEVLCNSQPDLTQKTIIQMGTISPRESQSLAIKIEQLGGDYLEAPVLGSIPEVRSGKLLVMVGSSETQFQKWQELLRNFSPQPILIGKIGTAAALKLALNQLIAGLSATFALSLSFVQKQGVPVAKFMDILRESALYAPTFDKKLTRMLERDYSNPNFPTKHLLKDINLFLEEAEEINLRADSLKGVREIVIQAVQLGWENGDYSALFESINNL